MVIQLLADAEAAHMDKRWILWGGGVPESPPPISPGQAPESKYVFFSKH
jgi:hypothetical protein